MNNLYLNVHSKRDIKGLQEDDKVVQQQRVGTALTAAALKKVPKAKAHRNCTTPSNEESTTTNDTRSDFVHWGAAASGEV